MKSMTTSMKAGKSFTARKAMYLNMAEDGIKIRSGKIESKKTYQRKQKHKSQRDW